MKIKNVFFVILLLTIHAIFHGMCTSLIYGSTDFPCQDDNCLSILPPLTSASILKQTTSPDSEDPKQHTNSNESLNQDKKIYFSNNTSITLACPRLGDHMHVTGKYKWTKIKPEVEILVLSEGSAPLRRTHLQLTENKTHYVIEIRNAKATDVGSYQCTIGDSIILQTIHVEMLVKPKIINIEPYTEDHLHSSKPNARLFTQYTQMVLACFVEGVPPPIVVWYRVDGLPLPDGGQAIVEGAVVSSVVISNLTLQHAGKYVCYANNSLGQNTQQEIEVIVQFRPTAVALKEVLRKSLNDEYVTLVCKVNAIPNATLKWLKDGLVLDASRDKKQFRFPIYCPDDGLMKFVLKTVKSRDYGNYTCLAENPLGNGSASILLSAKPVAPIVISNPTGTMMHEYLLMWQLNSTFRLPQVTKFTIRYELDSSDQNLNESDYQWTHVPVQNIQKKEEPQENIIFNKTLVNLRKNSTYLVMIQAMNGIKPHERGDCAFFEFQTAAMPIELSTSIYSVKDTLIKTTSSAGSASPADILTSFQKKQRKASTLHAPTNPGSVVMTAAVPGKSNNRAGHVSSSAVVMTCVVLCKLLLL